MKIKASTDLSNLEELDEITRHATIFFKEVVDVINGGLIFADNFRAKTISVAFDSADTDKQVSHGLGRVPTGYIVTGATAAMSVYDGSSASTKEVIYLKSNAAGTARILFY